MDQLNKRSTLICVVEDDDAVRRALAFSLDLEGFTVETYRSGEALLLDGQSELAGCLVVDERLPGLSGLDTLLNLRARQPNIPAILITSHPKSALRAAAAKISVPILEKPLLGETLVAMIVKLMDTADASK